MNRPSLIRDIREITIGITFVHKLYSLEGFAALAALAAVPDMTRNREVIEFCDNVAFEGVFQKIPANVNMPTQF